VGNKPPARGKLGTTRSVLTDGPGRPLGSAVDGANRPAMNGVDATLAAVIIKRPEPTATPPQPLCLDQGADDDAVREPREAWRDTAPMRRRGEEAQATRALPGDRARRWVGERTPAWMNRVRRWLIRWENNVAHDLAWLHVAWAWMTVRAAALFG
jgi:putative transposase